MTIEEITKIAQLVGIAIGSIGALAGGIGFLLYSYKKSGRTERKEVTDSANVISDFWENQSNKFENILKVKDDEFNAKLTATIKDFNTQIAELTGKLGVVTGQLTSEKALNDKLEKIFQNRNPEMETFMKFMVDATQKHSETHEAIMGLMQDQGKVLKDLHNMSTSNHNLLEQDQKKDLKIDATITKQ